MCHRYAAIPADGVYAAWLIRGGVHAGRQLASVSIGTNPTFSGRERRVEAYVLDFDGDLYGERVSLDFVAHLREQRAIRRHRAAGRADPGGRRTDPRAARR